MTENEISGLQHLIREPDVSDASNHASSLIDVFISQSHFLKVPSLPFHSLASLLAKFPTDIDSRVFWSAGVRDLLFGKSFLICGRQALILILSCTSDATYSKF